MNQISKANFAEVVRPKLNRMTAEVLEGAKEFYAIHGTPFTADELADWMDLNWRTVRPRCTDLKLRHKELEEVGRKRVNGTSFGLLRPVQHEPGQLFLFEEAAV